MRPEYDGVKYFGPNDNGNGYSLSKGVPILEQYCPGKDYENINNVLEFFNIYQLLILGRITSWDEETYIHYKTMAKNIPQTCEHYFSRISDDNFIAEYWSVCAQYVPDFWELFCRYNVYNRISKEKFSEFLSDSNVNLQNILMHKQLVQSFNNELAECMRVSAQSAALICKKFLEENNKVQLYFPNSLDKLEYESILQEYVTSDAVSPNILVLIQNAKNSDQCPISDYLRLTAKRSYEKFWASNPSRQYHFEYGIEIKFENQKEIFTLYNKENNITSYSYDIKWIIENLDYPTVLNNFMHLFGYFDFCWRSHFPAVKSDISAIEDVFKIKGKGFYPGGHAFAWKRMLYSAQMQSYYQILNENGVSLENVFVWFFESYIQEEFNVKGFSFQKPSEGSTPSEKIRNLASEMDAILKQFRILLERGEIDREYFEMSSAPKKFGDIGSFVKSKYAYGNSELIEAEMFNLFSDQTMLTFLADKKVNADSLYSMLQNYLVSISDFKDFQLPSINWMIERGSIVKDAEGMLSLEPLRVAVLKDLYTHDVICTSYCHKYQIVIDQMIKCGDLKYENTLFSRPEQDYLNYILNASQFSDGLDLRNKYIHGTYPKDEWAQQRDYIELLKIMILVIGKINEEFLLKDIQL